MANFNYGITCDDEKKAKKIGQFVSKLDLFQDGLDVSDDRVSVVSTQALLDELKKRAASQIGDLSVEIWPADAEYDDAESSGALEVHSIAGKTPRAAATTAPGRFRAYAGSKDKIDTFGKWLRAVPAIGLEVIEQWEPQVEHGTYGIEFLCTDPKFAKTANEGWVTQGVVTEKNSNDRRAGLPSPAARRKFWMRFRELPRSSGQQRQR